MAAVIKKKFKYSCFSILFAGLVDKLPNQNYLSNAGYKGRAPFYTYIIIMFN